MFPCGSGSAITLKVMQLPAAWISWVQNDIATKMMFFNKDDVHDIYIYIISYMIYVPKSMAIKRLCNVISQTFNVHLST